MSCHVMPKTCVSLLSDVNFIFDSTNSCLTRYWGNGLGYVDISTNKFLSCSTSAPVNFLVVVWILCISASTFVLISKSFQEEGNFSIRELATKLSGISTLLLDNSPIMINLGYTNFSVKTRKLLIAYFLFSKAYFY